MKRFHLTSLHLIDSVPTGFRRSLFHRISSDEKISGIIGPRGVGKSTLLLQLAKSWYKDTSQLLYLSLDDPIFAAGNLTEYVSEFVKHGGILLVLDEVDKYSEIVGDLKQIQSRYPDLKILFAGSSAGDDDGVIYDLSRLAELYYLPGLSFREYLEFRHELAFPIISFNELIEFNRIPGSEVLNRIRPLKYFEEFLRKGYYLTMDEPFNIYGESVREKIRKSISEDIMAAYRIDYPSVLKIFRILSNLASEGPMKPNIEKMADMAHTTRDSLLKFLKYLHKAGLITWLTSGNEDVNYLNKPDRLYLGNTDMVYALSLEDPKRGEILETFMIQHLKNFKQVNLISEGIFKVDLEYRFEANWMMNRKTSIIESNTYQLVDGIEARVGNKIPLWMLGFLY